MARPRGVLAQATAKAIAAFDRPALDFYLIAHASSLRVLPAATRPEEGQAFAGDHVRLAVATLRRQFGHIVLDQPHSFSDVTPAGLELADRVLLVATPEQITFEDVLEVRRVFLEVLGLPKDRLTRVLNHPVPCASVASAEFAAATVSPWLAIPFGGEAPTSAAVRGESLLSTPPTNPAALAMVEIARTIAAHASEQALVAGRALR